MWSNASAEKIVWTLPGGDLSSGVVLSVSEEGHYKVMVTYSNTCSASGVWNVREQSTDAVSSFLMASEAMAGDSVFLISLSHPLPLSHRWEATNGFHSEAEDPVVQFYKDGSYAMTLNVSNNECIMDKTKFIQIGDAVAAKYNMEDTVVGKNKIMEKDFDNSDDSVCSAVPNPSGNIFNITFDDGAAVEYAEYSVTTVMGKKVCGGNIVGGGITLNAENWRTGVYLLFIRTDKQSKVIKLMKI
jgi:hypothetical protein